MASVESVRQRRLPSDGAQAFESEVSGRLTKITYLSTCTRYEKNSKMTCPTASHESLPPHHCLLPIRLPMAPYICICQV